MNWRDCVEPTVMVTHIGDQGATAADGLIYPPKVALVGFGSHH